MSVHGVAHLPPLTPKDFKRSTPTSPLCILAAWLILANRAATRPPFRHDQQNSSPPRPNHLSRLSRHLATLQRHPGHPPPPRPRSRGLRRALPGPPRPLPPGRCPRSHRQRRPRHHLRPHPRPPQIGSAFVTDRS